MVKRESSSVGPFPGVKPVGSKESPYVARMVAVWQGGCIIFLGLLSQITASWVASTTEIYPLTFLEARRLKSGRATSAPGIPGDSLPSFASFWCFKRSLTCGHITPVSAPSSYGLLFCVFVSSLLSLMRTLVVGCKTHPDNLRWPHPLKALSLWHLQWPFSHKVTVKVPEVRTRTCLLGPPLSSPQWLWKQGTEPCASAFSSVKWT